MTISPRPISCGLIGVFVLLASHSATGQGWEVPKPAIDLKPGTARYRVTIEAKGQKATMDVTRVIVSQNGTWLVTNTTKIGDRVQTDEITVEKKTLIIRTRHFHSGNASADLEFKGTRVTGVIADSKSKVDVDTDLGGVIFADGSGGEAVLAALPLAKNYTTEFRNYNIGSQLVKTLQLRVVDSETVTVPAGTFDTWKVIITSVEGGTDTYGLWVEKRTHRLIKVADFVAGLDAMATAELVAAR